ncbi:Piwi-domain-containing protein [Lepidopterella palustris CBS 459.81]|uniref:Piwi-domain-containing protein n=1 Tax=Lepidopterella palustris CBS 459.81 TaxID=1314670 RepID=A0A8E2ELV5_9PEZI|nr:Piwi-domain-containing protein [Lepidopterella palustris CBS 459.81]
MAGPGKRRAQAERVSQNSSEKHAASEHATTTQEQSRESSTGKSPPRYDGNRDPQTLDLATRTLPPAKYANLRNIAEGLGMAGWAVARGFELPPTLPSRPQKFNSQGKEISVTLNTFNVLQLPTRPVFQYDVTIGKGDEKRGLIKKIWESKTVKAQLGVNNMWLYDGNKLAWSMMDISRPELRIVVDIDKEENRQNIKPDKVGKNIHKVFIRKTKKVDFAGLSHFLEGKASWSNDCIDTINFLDHVMREWPSQRYTQIKKSFFQRGEQRFSLGQGIEAFKGVFSSLRPVLNDKGGKGLTVNVDVANGTFWTAQPLGQALGAVFNASGIADLQGKFRNAKNDWDKSFFKKDLNRFRKLHVVDTHRPDKQHAWCIDKFIVQDCSEKKFTDGDGKNMTIEEYFQKKYNKKLNRNLPLVKMTKPDVYLPIEVLRIEPNQRYNAKLNEQQTSQMIKFAVTLPPQRWAAVQSGLNLLDWANDPYLKHYGIRINPTAAEVKSRILPTPNIVFGGNDKILAPQAKGGRWRIDNLKFLTPNTTELRAWGVCVVSGRPSDINMAQKFVEEFVKTYQGHGGKFHADGKQPYIGLGNLAQGGEMVSKIWSDTGNKFTSRPQFLVFVVPDRNAEVYRRIKKSCDCRYGVVSQVLQYKHVREAKGQYISNVCMKVNAKLGGSTSRAVGVTLAKVAPNNARTPTMIIGADVSHPAPGSPASEAASFCAITVSQDSNYTRYMAQCDTNGHRVEMITTRNIQDHLGKMAKHWIQNVGKGSVPQRVLYVRDGVSEGQYQHVLDQEVRDMKALFKDIAPKADPAFTVVVAGKRHHIRFFPKGPAGDRNGNPMPGTLVEAGCTHPFEFDFYLCAHSAIKGTARPIHYQVILNEGKWGGEELQQFLLEHSFQYARSTTPVSLFPAVYYAHLAADRARAHENAAPVSSGKKESRLDRRKSETSSSDKPPSEILPLIPMAPAGGINTTMWYI